VNYRRAVEIKPDFAEAHSNLGTALRELGRLDDAVANCRRALEIKADFAAAHNNLGNALNDLAKADDAVASYRPALEINPGLAEVHNNLGNALSHLGRLDEAAASCRRALEVNPNFANAHSNLLFCLSHNPLISSQTLFAEYCHFGAQFEPPLRAGWPLHRNARDPARRLKIGLVSADLRDHSVAHFIEPLLPHLAASSGLSIHAYHNHTVEDGVTARLRDHIQHWHRIAGLSDLAVAQQIGDDGIDILIDPFRAHGRKSAIGLCAQTRTGSGKLDRLSRHHRLNRHGLLPIRSLSAPRSIRYPVHGKNRVLAGLSAVPA
jgi:protein O-GlcNAc transferase